MVEGLKLCGVSHQYRKTSFFLNVAALSGNMGEVMCLLGPSGCGKSTILKLIAGLERLYSGSISINGRVVADVQNNIHISTEKRNVGLIFQHPSLFHHQTIVENVAFAVKCSRREQRVNRALKILDSVNMVEYRDAYPHMLSGGQQQLVTIARAIAQRPEVILLDEPFSNLDTVLKAQIRSSVLSLLKEEGITVLLVTHDPEEALEVADVVYVVREGCIVQHGTPREIYYKPKDPMLAQFFGKSNYVESIVKDRCVSLGVWKIPADSFDNGDAVAVCIRPETILSSSDCDVVAVVKLVRFFNNMVYIDVGGQGYWMRFLGHVLPKVGDVIYVSLNFSEVLLFKL